MERAIQLNQMSKENGAIKKKMLTFYSLKIPERKKKLKIPERYGHLFKLSVGLIVARGRGVSTLVN